MIGVDGLLHLVAFISRAKSASQEGAACLIHLSPPAHSLGHSPASQPATASLAAGSAGRTADRDSSLTSMGGEAE